MDFFPFLDFWTVKLPGPFEDFSDFEDFVDHLAQLHQTISTPAKGPPRKMAAIGPPRKIVDISQHDPNQDF